MSETYNGWSNYETWCVKLWLDNDGWEYDRSMGRTVYSLSVNLKAMVNDTAPDLGASMFADLLGAAIDSVNFREIAEGILEDYEAEDEDETEADEA